MSATTSRFVLAGLAGLSLVIMTGCSTGSGTVGAVGAATSSSGATQVSGAVSADPAGATPVAQPAAAESGSTTSAVPDTPAGPLRLISALGTGRASGVPDIATVTLGVQTTAAAAQAALADNNQRSADLLTVLQEQGVARSDIQTNQVSVSPTYDGAGGITGYQVSNFLTATIRPLSSAGTVLDAVTRATGDAIRVQWIALSIDDDTPVRTAARADAVAQARAQAEQLAAAAGVTLGPVVSVTESPTTNGGAYQSYAASADASSIPIEAGMQEVSVQVQVVFEMR